MKKEYKRYDGDYKRKPLFIISTNDESIKTLSDHEPYDEKEALKRWRDINKEIEAYIRLQNAIREQIMEEEKNNIERVFDRICVFLVICALIGVICWFIIPMLCNA